MSPASGPKMTHHVCFACDPFPFLDNPSRLTLEPSLSAWGSLPDYGGKHHRTSCPFQRAGERPEGMCDETGPCALPFSLKNDAHDLALSPGRGPLLFDRCSHKSTSKFRRPLKDRPLSATVNPCETGHAPARRNDTKARPVCPLASSARKTLDKRFSARTCGWS